MYPELKATIERLGTESELIAPERRQLLEAIATWVDQRLASNVGADLLFICTHNSRRSHLAQAWAAAAAVYQGIDGVRCFSGGVEVTEVHLNIVDALIRQGFIVDGSDGPNPAYMVNIDPELEPALCWSKLYDDPENPQKDFAAVMVCSDAEEACPFVAAADARFSLPYRDPKEADDRPEEQRVYDERSLEIAREMVYLFSKVK